VLVSHANVVFGVPGDPDPDRMLADWKAYASRPLNRLVGWPPPAASAITQREAAKARRPVWWEVEGSTRPLKTVESRIRAIRYVRDQENPLAVWLSDGARRLLEEYPEPAPEPS